MKRRNRKHKQKASERPLANTHAGRKVREGKERQRRVQSVAPAGMQRGPPLVCGQWGGWVAGLLSLKTLPLLCQHVGIHMSRFRIATCQHIYIYMSGCGKIVLPGPMKEGMGCGVGTKGCGETRTPQLGRPRAGLRVGLSVCACAPTARVPNTCTAHPFWYVPKAKFSHSARTPWGTPNPPKARGAWSLHAHGYFPRGCGGGVRGWRNGGQDGSRMVGE